MAQRPHPDTLALTELATKLVNAELVNARLLGRIKQLQMLATEVDFSTWDPLKDREADQEPLTEVPTPQVDIVHALLAELHGLV